MDQYDVIAVILGVMFTLRKLDTQSRNAANHPTVNADDFRIWQRQTAAAYAPGAYFSFLRVLFHFLFIRYVKSHPLPPAAFARIALLVDLVWIIAVVTTLVRAHYARERRRKLGISLERPEPSR